METFLGSMITIFVVSVVMGLLTKSKQDKKTSSIYKFTVRASSAIMFIAVATMAEGDSLQRTRVVEHRRAAIDRYHIELRENARRIERTGGRLLECFGHNDKTTVGCVALDGMAIARVVSDALDISTEG